MASPRARSRHVVSFSLASACLLACTQPEEPQTYDPDETLATAAAFATELERLDLAPIDTIHNMEMGYAEIYANAEAAEVFRSIDGTDPTATAEFPRGSILVKNNLDEAMQPMGVLTVMAKFEDGYSDETDDWFFAMITTDGEVIDDVVGGGAEVVFCYDCHAQMGANTDAVIGLPPEQLR